MDGHMDILDLTIDELARELEEIGIKRYRADQIYEWLYRGVLDFDKMTNISKEMRILLANHFRSKPLKILDKIEANDGSTRKYLFLLEDKNIIESVVMRYVYGNTICISTQVGCKMGCDFCASTKEGFIRHLTPGEMVAQVLEAEMDLGIDGDARAIKNIVLMGSGEPLDNYENTLKFLNIVHEPLGLNMSYRNITLSTCGLVPRIYELSDENIPITLSISLHAPNDNIRQQIMPIARVYSIDDVIEASKYYFKKTGRRVTFEYALIENINDKKEHAVELAKRLEGFPCHVNIIPVNKIRGSQYVRSDERNINRFMDILEAYNLQVTRRRELGHNIQGACGQLRRDYLSRYMSNFKEE